MRYANLFRCFSFHIKYLAFLILLLSQNTIIKAQGETNNWYFGTNAGLDFNTNPPTVLTNGALIAPEGVASISNQNGQLLFYTDGEVIYNADHEIMTNGAGLAGENTATQSALIIPKPLSDHLYYVFTLGANGGFGTTTDGLSYSVVDMNFSNGKGAVTEKNISMLSNATEKQRAIPHANGRDFWLVTHAYDSNAFNTFLVSCQGVQLEPVVSRVGRLHRESNSGCCQGFAAEGAMAISKNHRRLAVTWNEITSFSLGGPTVSKWQAELFDFNPNTGKLSNPLTLSNQNGIDQFLAYGICFSPDQKRLYLSVQEAAKIPKLLQFDLTKDEIFATRMEIARNLDEQQYGALEIGPDGKIYVARNQLSYLSVINNPNQLGDAVSYEEEGVDLGIGRSRLGLPNILYDYRSTAFYDFFPRDTTICFEEQLFLSLDTLNATSYLWDDGNTFSEQRIEVEGLHWLEIETESCGNGRDSINLSLQDCTCRVVFPNAFSPNDDGANDFFAPVLATCEYDIYQLNIYSRNGDLVFSTEDKMASWDGNLKGKRMPSATYVYYLLYKNPKEKGLQRLTGSITLLR
ncbi:MAG: gliding motility-associated C-terminal domain-containing protein [Saprospiraceae bacterium]